MAEIVNAYEAVFVVSVNLGDEGIASTVEKFKTLVSENGTLESVDEWGKRRLAYPINKQPEGYYVLMNFTSAPAFTKELSRIFGITEGILRSMVVMKPAVAEKPAKAEAPVQQEEAPAAEEAAE